MRPDGQVQAGEGGDTRNHIDHAERRRAVQERDGPGRRRGREGGGQRHGLAVGRGGGAGGDGDGRDSVGRRDFVDLAEAVGGSAKAEEVALGVDGQGAEVKLDGSGKMAMAMATASPEPGTISKSRRARGPHHCGREPEQIAV